MRRIRKGIRFIIWVFDEELPNVNISESPKTDLACIRIALEQPYNSWFATIGKKTFGFLRRRLVKSECETKTTAKKRIAVIPVVGLGFFLTSYRKK